MFHLPPLEGIINGGDKGVAASPTVYLSILIIIIQLSMVPDQTHPKLPAAMGYDGLAGWGWG